MKIISLHTPQHIGLNANYETSNHAMMVKFVPSIELFKTSTTHSVYIVTFRVWRRYGTNVAVNGPGSIGHPWYNYWKYSSYDGSAYFFLEISRDLKTIKIRDEKIPKAWNGLVDMRILRKSANKYYVTFNSFSKLSVKEYAGDYNKIKKGLKPLCFENKNGGLYPGGCTLQETAMLTISKTLSAKLSNRKLVCAQHHTRLEKNHAMFIENNQLSFQYTIVPWVFFTSGCKKKSMVKNAFKNIVNFYDKSKSNFFSRFLQFSCSTPLVSYNELEYLAVGHFKIKYDDIDQIRPQTPLHDYIKSLKHTMNIKSFGSAHKNGKVHYALLYGMFLYTVNKNDLTLNRMSPSFSIMDKEPSALSFPTGIVKHSDDDFLISYHENDINIKLLHVTVHDIENLLIYNNNVSPKTYKFIII
jgi:hypothetical protein